MSNSNVLINKFILICLFSINIFSIEKPNVVIILTDDLGWGDVSYNGGDSETVRMSGQEMDGKGDPKDFGDWMDFSLKTK